MTTKDQGQQAPDTTLADLRRQAGLTQAQVAEHMGVTPGRISHLEARYPYIKYERLLAYMQAIGTELRFTGPNGINVYAHQMGEDTSRTTDALDRASAAGRERRKREHSAAKELPLQGDQPQPGSDDTGREVDQADPQGDQSDGAQRQQP